MQIIDYYTVITKFRDELDSLVCIMINKGWQPYGNQYVNGVSYIQPMVKYANN